MVYVIKNNNHICPTSEYIANTECLTKQMLSTYQLVHVFERMVSSLSSQQHGHPGDRHIDSLPLHHLQSHFHSHSVGEVVWCWQNSPFFPPTY